MNDERIERLENELKTINERIERLEQSQARNIDQLEDEYMTREQYAKAHKITPRTVDRYIATGKLKAIKAFNRVLIPLDQEPPRE